MPSTLHFSRSLLFLAVNILLLIFAVRPLCTQPVPDSKGQDFIFTFPPNMHDITTEADTLLLPPLMIEPQHDSLYVFIAATEVPTHGEIRYRNIRGETFTHSFTITDVTQVYIFRLPWRTYELMGINDAGTFNNRNDQGGKIAPQSFRVTTDRDVTVYAANRAGATSDAMLVLPTDVLGKEYRIVSYYSDGQLTVENKIDWALSTPSQFAVVAQNDNTVVTITPSVPVYGPTSTTFTVTLNAGDAYLLQAKMTPQNLRGDLTGSLVMSTEPIAVFGSHQRALIPVTSASLMSRNHLLEQLPPVNTWGNSYILTPFPRPSHIASPVADIVRILAAHDNTVVMLDGLEIARLQAGEFYEAYLRNPAQLIASREVLVIQYKHSSRRKWDEFPPILRSDPLMLIVPPRKQFLTSYTCVSAQITENRKPVFTDQYCTIICPTDFISTVRIDGNRVDTSLFIPVSCYSYGWFPLAGGSHIIESQGPDAKPIGVQIYGYGVVDSYGYTGGMAYTTTAEARVILDPDTTICAGDSVQLTLPGGIFYRWFPSEGLSCDDCPAPIAKPKSSTRYSLTFVDSLRCTFQSNILVDVQPYPKPLTTRAITICRNQPIQLQTSEARFYTWSPPDGLSCTDCRNPIANPTETTTYKVLMSNGSHCLVEDSIVVTVKPSPQFELPVDTLICSQDSIVLHLPNDATYQWFPTTGLSCATCSELVVRPKKTTKYTIVASNTEGCQVATTMTVTVVDSPVASVSPDVRICEHDAGVRLNAVGGNFYRWSPPDGLSCTDCASPFAQPDKTTTYTVEVSINATCKTIAHVTVSVLPAPVPTVSADATVCADVPVQLSASGGTSYHWQPAEGLSCIDCPNPTATPQVSTMYYVNVKNDEGCTVTDSVHITVLRLADVNVSLPQTICSGESVLLEATGGTSYHWEPAEGLSCTNCSSPTASPKQTILYTVTITGENGCTETRKIPVEVRPLPQITVSNDTTICTGGTASLYVEGGSSYLWWPDNGLDCSNCAAPHATPSQTTMYYVRVSSNGTCNRTDSVLVTVEPCGLEAEFISPTFAPTAVCDSAAQTGVLRNTGQQPLTILSWEITGTDAASFYAQAPDITLPYILGAQESLPFRMVCHPQREGVLSADIAIQAEEDIEITNTLTATAYYRQVFFTLDPDIRTIPGSKIQLNIEAHSDQWDGINTNNLELSISYKSAWMQYAGEIKRGPALDESWHLTAREENNFNGEHTIVITATGEQPIQMSGTIATITVKPLLSDEFIYTPRVEAQIINQENCIETEGDTTTLDIAFCAAELRAIRYNNIAYEFGTVNGSIVSGNEVQVHYNVALVADTRIELYNQLGELITKYHRTAVQPGEYNETLSLPQIPAGVYIARFSSGPFSKSIPLLVGTE